MDKILYAIIVLVMAFLFHYGYQCYTTHHMQEYLFDVGDNYDAHIKEPNNIYIEN